MIWPMNSGVNSQLLLLALGCAIVAFAMLSVREQVVSERGAVGLASLGVLIALWGAGGVAVAEQLSDDLRALRRPPAALHALSLYGATCPASVRVRLEDRQDLKRIARALEGAPPWTPYARGAGWSCHASLDLGDRAVLFTITRLPRGDALVEAHSLRGLAVGSFRSPGLGLLIEELVAQARTSND